MGLFIIAIFISAVQANYRPGSYILRVNAHRVRICSVKMVSLVRDSPVLRFVLVVLRALLHDMRV